MLYYIIYNYATYYKAKFTAHPPLQPCCCADACKTHPSAPPCVASNFRRLLID